MASSPSVRNLQLRRAADQVQRGLCPLGVVGEIGNSGDDGAAGAVRERTVRQNSAERIDQLCRIGRQRDIRRDVDLGGVAHASKRKVVYEIDSRDGGSAVEDPELRSQQGSARDHVIRGIEVEYRGRLERLFFQVGSVVTKVRSVGGGVGRAQQIHHEKDGLFQVAIARLYLRGIVAAAGVRVHYNPTTSRFLGT